MLLVILSLSLLITYIVVSFTKNAIKYHKAQQFFKLYSPKMPVLPGTRLFSGHVHQVIIHDKNYKKYQELHKKYGPTFGLYFRDLPFVATTDLDLIKFVELDQGHKHINRAFLGLPIEEFRYSIFQVRNEEWRQVRRAVAAALTNHKVRGEEILDFIKQTLDKIEVAIDKKFEAAHQEGETSITIDVEDFMERYTLAMIFLLTYKRSDIDFEADQDYWTELIHGAAENFKNPVLVYGAQFAIPKPLVNFFLQFFEVGRAPNRLNKFVLDAVAANVEARRDPEKATKNGYRRTLIDYLIDAYHDHKIKQRTFMATGAFMILAGFETTGTTLTGLIWQLVKEPKVQEKLRTVITNEGEDSDYVTWAILEAVRHYPSVISGTGRTLSEDVTINGLLVPKGSFVMPSTYAIHMDPKIWPEPEKFIPERFRDPSSRHAAAFMGFGLGPRNCVGGKLAVQEMRMMISFLLTRYRIEACDETPEEFDFSAPGNLWLNLDNPVKVKLKRL